MGIPDKAWIAIGTIIAAVIAGLISFVNILISKDQKTTELRQMWIDALRQSMSEFTSQAVTMVSLRNVTRPLLQKYLENEETQELFYSDLSNYFKEQSRLSLELRNKLLLYLNPKEHQDLIQDISELHRASYIDSQIDDDAAFAASEKVIKGTQKVLKSEWERVKRGERFYRVTKNVLAFILIVALFCVVYSVVQFRDQIFNVIVTP